MRSSAAIALLLAASAASAQEFAGMAELQAQISGVQAQARAQKSIPQSPKIGAMGVSAGSGDDGLDATAAPDVTKYQVRGIDISHHQLTIDWSLVKTAGLSFVYVKATEGADIVDERFAANWAGAADAGLARGA